MKPRYFLETKDKKMFIPRLSPESMDDLRLTIITDASDGSMQKGKSQGAYAIGMQTDTSAPEEGEALFASVITRSHRIKRVAHSSYDAEMLEIVEAIDHGLLLSLLVEELRRCPRPSMWERHLLAAEGKVYYDMPTKIKLWTDSKSSIDKVASDKDADGTARRRRVDIADVRELVAYDVVEPLGFVHGEVNPLDVGTKDKPVWSQPARAYRRLLYGGYFDPQEQPEVWKKKRPDVHWEDSKGNSVDHGDNKHKGFVAVWLKQGLPHVPRDVGFM